jgi:hypothetical protein
MIMCNANLQSGAGMGPLCDATIARRVWSGYLICSMDVDDAQDLHVEARVDHA